MSKNTGKPSEKQFEARLNSMGKVAAHFRLVDASEITGRTGKIAISARAQPADYVIVMDGKTTLAEVKSTANPTSFPFSMIKQAQWIAGTLTMTAGGAYLVFIHRLTTDEWYKVPFEVIWRAKQTNKSSFKWAELSEYIW